jgi:hypothetical protein
MRSLPLPFRRSRSVFATSVLAAALAVGRVDAMTVTPMTFDELVRDAWAVVYARVADVRGQWSADHRTIDSIVTVEALRYFKGGPAQTVQVRLPGGTLDGKINVLPGAPVLREGELVVLFLSARGPAMPTALGMSQGVFRIVRDARTGGVLVSPPPLRASPAGLVVRGAADRRLLSLEAFEGHVRSMGAVR